MGKKYQPAYRFVLRAIVGGNEVYVTKPMNLQPAVTDRISDATVYDDRDNGDLKAKFFNAATGLKFQQVRI